MDEMASILSYQQSIEDLQHSLLCTTLELDSAQLALKEEKRRNEENIKQFLQLLQVAYQERDEAKTNLQRLMNKIMQLGPSQLCHVLPNIQPETPPIIPMKGTSSFTESDSLSENYNRRSYISSSVDSFLDAGTSSELSTINMADSITMDVRQQPLIQEYNASSTFGLSSQISQIDPASLLIEQLAGKRPLPEKGKLLQAVMEAGPLLQTLMLAGPLPEWRNPPPFQALQMPPVSIGGHNSAILTNKCILHRKNHVQSPLVSSCHEHYKTTQTCSPSLLNNSSSTGSCMKRRMVSPSDVGGDLLCNSSPILNLKRQKLH